MRTERTAILQWKIEEIRKIYTELGEFHKDSPCTSEIRALRRLVTLDIEEADAIALEERSARIQEIQKLITELGKLPQKF